MKISRIKFLSLLMACLMVLILSAGCGSPTETQQTTMAAGTTAAGTTTSKATETSVKESEPMYPISKDGVELTVFAGMGGFLQYVNNFNELESFKAAERITGVKISWIAPPDSAKKEQFQLLFAGGDLPDIIYADWSGGGNSEALGGAVKFADDGYILTLNDAKDDLISKFAPNLKKILEERPDVKKDMSNDEGKIFTFPMLRLDARLRVFKGLQMRSDWLGKLSMNAPTTTDEWYTVLKAIKEKDPNGNGKPDEIPLTATKWGTNNDVRYFTFAFGTSYDYFIKDGKMTYGPVQNGYKDYLAFMNKLYKEELLDPDFAIQDGNAMRNKVISETAASWFGFSGGQLSTYTNLMTKPTEGKPAINPDFSLVGVPWPKDPTGKSAVIDGEYINTVVSGLAAAVTTSCKNKEAAVRWLDFGYSEEGQLAYNYGTEGVTYNLVNGQPTYSDLLYKDPNVKWPDTLKKYVVPQVWVTNQGVRYFEQFMIEPAQKAIEIWSKADASMSIPPIQLTPDESQEFSNIMSAVKTYVEEHTLQMILGKESLDNFDKFVQDIKGMGIDKAVEVRQKAYDRYVKR